VIAHRCASLFRTFQRVLFVVSVIAVFSITPVSTQQFGGKTESSVLEREKAAVASVENEWINALNSANVNAIAEILADDFVRPVPDYGGFVTKADLLPLYRSHLSPGSSNQRRIEGLTVTLYGSTALARGAVTTRNFDGHLTSKLLFTDVFVRANRKWQAVSAQENAVTTLAHSK